MFTVRSFRLDIYLIYTVEHITGKVVEVQKESAAETALNDEEHADLMASFADRKSVV